MTRRHSLDLLRELVDHELVDSEGVSCGIVDDVEFRNTADGPAVDALLVGPGAWLPRLPALLQWAGERIFGRGIVRVPWSEVEHVAETIRLRSKASALELGRMDRKVATWLSHLPKS
jgi:sporulation protein YlmC with PRC-barrel domain